MVTDKPHSDYFISGCGNKQTGLGGRREIGPEAPGKMIYKGLPGQFPERLSLNGNETKGHGDSLVGRML